MKDFVSNFLLFTALIGVLFAVFVLAWLLRFGDSEASSVDCESHLDFYLVNDYVDEDGFFYADISNFTRIDYVGGGVFIGAR